MGIPAPSFNYASLATPGGIGQGLASLGGALADASARRRQAEVDQAKLDFEKQGLARLQANDVADRSQRAMQFQDSVNHNRAQEEYQQGQLKRQDGLAALANTRYTEGMKRQNTLDDEARLQRGEDSARRGKLDASAIRLNDAHAKYYATPKIPSQAADHKRAVDLQYENLAEKQAQKEFEDSQMAHATAVKKATGVLWNSPMPPAPPTLDALRAKYRANLGLSPIGNTATNAANTGSHVAPSAPSLRDRVTALYGNDLHPEIAKSLAEAETGDQESAAQLEGILQQHAGAQEGEGAAETVAPGEELDLLGNPRYPR